MSATKSHEIIDPYGKGKVHRSLIIKAEPKITL